MILSYRGESQPLLLPVLAALSVGCASMTDDSYYQRSDMQLTIKSTLH
jgi:hypothetical protein